ncbi:MAG TPA: hypothetical protein VGD66_07935 [Allosphingosinicella sp.]|jgi:hypothetical protein
MSDMNHLEGLPKYQGKSVVSLLFLMTSDKATVDGAAIVIPGNAAMIVFSDRPHRIARPLQGGVLSFANFYARSNFVADPPNATFAGSTAGGNQEVCSVLELGTPQVEDGQVRFPILQAVGQETAPAQGDYQNVSMVIDNFWSSVGSDLQLVGEVVGTVALGAGTAVACTVGEVATVGADTAACVAGVAGTVAAGTAAAGSAISLGAST